MTISTATAKLAKLARLSSINLWPQLIISHSETHPLLSPPLHQPTTAPSDDFAFAPSTASSFSAHSASSLSSPPFSSSKASTSGSAFPVPSTSSRRRFTRKLPARLPQPPLPTLRRTLLLLKFHDPLPLRPRLHQPPPSHRRLTSWLGDSPISSSLRTSSSSMT